MRGVNSDLAQAFEMQASCCGKLVTTGEMLVSGGIAVDGPGKRFVGESTGQIHLVAPNVIDELVFADHAGDDRSGADADAQRQMA